MAEESLVVFATFPDLETARRIVRKLVEERLAACGNLIPGVESIYRWQGAVETSAEILVILKTDHTRYPQLEKRLSEMHPYDVPECLALPVNHGLPAYLQWVADSTRAT
jgi:periplasmic divalent cation tolerance protein